MFSLSAAITFKKSMTQCMRRGLRSAFADIPIPGSASFPLCCADGSTKDKTVLPADFVMTVIPCRHKTVLCVVSCCIQISMMQTAGEVSREQVDQLMERIRENSTKVRRVCAWFMEFLGLSRSTILYYELALTESLHL